MGIAPTNGLPSAAPTSAAEHGSHSGASTRTADFPGALQSRLQGYGVSGPSSAGSATAATGAHVQSHAGSGAGGRSGHIPLRGAQSPDSDDHIHERALKIRAYRMQLLASNIANADTPGYKARDIDVAEALRMKIESPEEIPVKYVTPSQPSVDGNTVDMDVARAKFAENALMYQFSLDRVSGHYRDMMDLFQKLKD